MATTQILIADDQPLFRFGIRAALSPEPDLRIVGEGKDGYEVQQLYQALLPDILLMDLTISGRDTKETVLYLKKSCPNIKVIIFSACMNKASILEAFSFGIRGYILKNEEGVEALVRAIQTVARGDTWFSNRIIEILANKDIRPSPIDKGLTHNSPLSHRECEIMQYLAEGLSNNEIAKALCISERTVRHYVETIMRKLGATNRTKAVVVAIQNNWVFIE